MTRTGKKIRPLVAVLLSLSSLRILAQSPAPSTACEQAWAEYNEFKARYVMEATQYPLTVQGAAVRAACGAEALPVSPGSDDPPPPRVRHPQPKPPEPVPPRTP
jgi:hypothetical protein